MALPSNLTELLHRAQEGDAADLLLHARALRALGDDARAKAQEGLARLHLRPLAQR